ncbi:DUF1499 domain-containing protein [Comamonadaceae bacterium M7527]|nr:DUF1499 domain-containing protein [Comamonadaceae bacterium M7527]
MKQLVQLLIIMLIAIPILLVVAGQLGMLSGSMPNNLGVNDGKLKGLSATRNSVSSQANLYPDHPMRSYADLEPLPLVGDAKASMAKLVTTLKATAGVSIEEQRDDYIRAQARTKLLGFVDDLEFWLNKDAGYIDVRSASRLGREDFGVNRKRLETLRAAYLQ